MSTAAIAGKIAEVFPRLKARIAGFFYLIIIVGGIFAEVFVRGKLVVAGDPAATAHNIMAHESLYRWGFAVEAFYCACVIPVTVIFYDLFKVVNKSLAAIEALLGLTGNAVESVSLLAFFAPLVLLGGGRYLSAFSAEQLQSAAYVSLKLFEHGFAICLAFFGFDCLLAGYLIIRSTFFPRVIGVLLAFEGLCYLINSYANFLAPQFAERFFPVLAASAIAEISLCLWLLVMGVNEQRWKEQASLATQV